MRIAVPLMTLACLVACCGRPARAVETELLNMPLPAPYARAVRPETLTTAERAAEAARLRARLAARIERPLERKALTAAIERAEAEVLALDHLIAHYEQISRPLYSDPFLYSLSRLRLARLAAAQQLDLLHTRQQGLWENYHALRRLETLQP